MKLSEFKGLDPKVGQLIRNARNGSIMHALLFTGPEGTGKRSMAELIARTALCTNEGERPCDECAACRQCLEGVHPDVHVVALEEGRKQIRIEQIRELQEKLSLASYAGGKKIVMIENAESMNNFAQNAILKTLEEPTGDTLFFLMTTSPGSMLPTIISRCLQVRFFALEVNACADVLVSRGIGRQKAEICAALAAGCVGKALELSEDEEYFVLRQKVIGAVESIHKTGDVPNAVNMIGKIKDPAMGDRILDILELWSWDLMRIQNGNEPLEKDESERLKKSKISGNRLLRMITDARKQTEVNISRPNILEPILFEIAELQNAGKT